MHKMHARLFLIMKNQSDKRVTRLVTGAVLQTTLAIAKCMTTAIPHTVTESIPTKFRL